MSDPEKYAGISWFLTTKVIRQQFIEDILGGKLLPCPLCNSFDVDLLETDDNRIDTERITCLGCKMIAYIDYWPYRIPYK